MAAHGCSCASAETEPACRAAKYGTKITEKDLNHPKPGLIRDELRKSRALKKAGDAVTGFDMFNEEEVEKQNARAARFGIAPPETGIAVAQPSPDEDAKKARAAKYGIEYTEPDRSGAALPAHLLFDCRIRGHSDAVSRHTRIFGSRT